MDCVKDGSSRSAGTNRQPFCYIVEADFFSGVVYVLTTSRLRLFLVGCVTPGKAGKLYLSVLPSALEAEPYRPT